MAADDENPCWADPELREQFFDIDPVTGRHRRFFDIDELAGVRQEDPEVFEVTHALALDWCRRRGRRAAHRPPRRPRRPGRLPASGCASAGCERVWVEKILEPGEELRDWPVDGHGRLRVPERRDGALRRPGRRGAADRALRELTGERAAFARVADEAKLEQARDAPSSPRSSGCGGCVDDPRHGRRGRVAAGLPHLRRPATGRVADADREARRGGRPARARAPSPAARRAGPRRVRRRASSRPRRR